MVITSIKNQYHGVNAHLNSQLQAPKGAWEAFHTDHISDIRIHLTRQLLGTSYVAKLEGGIQIRRRDLPAQLPKSEVLITSSLPRRSVPDPTTLSVETAHRLFKLGEAIPQLELSESTEYFPSVQIYNLEQDDIPVAWLELLSPSNKQGGRHADEYLKKRKLILETQTCLFIEIDYLHQTSPTIANVADYSQQELHAHPYRISVIDSRTHFQAETGYVVEFDFDIDSPIPKVVMPLLGNDVLHFDLNSVYQTTYESGLYGVNPLTQTNYRLFPRAFDTYALPDQQKIIRRMLTVIDAAKNGLHLEGSTIPLPIDESRIQTLLADQYPILNFAPAQLQVENL